MAPIAPARKPLEYRFDQASFGRHQTFHLRYAWLTKGFQATIWLIHWLLATNGAQATVWRWFFNHFHQAEFSLPEAGTALTRFVQERLGNPLGNPLGTRAPPKTMVNDLRILLRMYEPSAVGPRVPLEDALDSPLSILGLVRPLPETHRHRSAAEERDGPPDGVFGYAVADLFDQIGLRTLPIAELMYGRPGFPALGAVFRLTENALVTKLERIIRRLPGRFTLREQAGVHQLYSLRDAIDPMDYLGSHYRAGQPGGTR